MPLVLMTGFGYDPGHSIVKARQAKLPAVRRAVQAVPPGPIARYRRTHRADRGPSKARPLTARAHGQSRSAKVSRCGSARDACVRRPCGVALVVGVQIPLRRSRCLADLSIATCRALALVGHGGSLGRNGQSLARYRLAAQAGQDRASLTSYAALLVALAAA